MEAFLVKIYFFKIYFFLWKNCTP